MSAKFSHISFPISTLLGQIKSGQIALPELQRPFVWDRAQVRDLLDSLYRGYPAGYFLLWQAHPEAKFVTISGNTQAAPSLLVVDGQQRLTSLYAVFLGESVYSERFTREHIRIAFNPRSERFEVANTIISNDPEWIADVSTLLKSPNNSFAFINAYLDKLRHSRGETLTVEQANQLAFNLQRLAGLTEYPFNAIQLSHDLPVEEVSEIFVRVNSKGTQLSQANFILTLMSVFWDEGRKDLEAFCREAKEGAKNPTSKNPFIEPSPDQLLRVAIGLGHRRAALKYVYELLRGKDLATKEVTDANRDKNFAILAEAQAKVLDLTNWWEFLKGIHEAGYLNSSMLMSKNSLIYSYLVFLVGRCRHGIDWKILRNAIARWFFVAALTSRYTNSPESRVEKDLRLFEEAQTGDQFLATLDSQIQLAVPTDFWTHTLPSLLNWSGVNIPALYAYFAALNVLDAKALFSTLPMHRLLEGGISGRRSAVERHHLFPRKFLEASGIKSRTQINQVANFAMIEWPDNLRIGAKSPAVYFPPMFEQHVAAGEAEQFRFWHALPEGWEGMGYSDFLEARRKRMAEVVKAGFEKLSTGRNLTPKAKAVEDRLPTVVQLIAAGESLTVEFKSSLYATYVDGVPEKVIVGSVLKTIAAMLNTDGGTLVIGVADDGTILGLEKDYQLKKMDADKFENALMTTLMQSIDSVSAHLCKVRFENLEGKEVALVDVRPSPRPVYADTDKGKARFFTRLGNTTRDLETSDAVSYISRRWGLQA